MVRKVGEGRGNLDTDEDIALGPYCDRCDATTLAIEWKFVPTFRHRGRDRFRHVARVVDAIDGTKSECAWLVTIPRKV